MRLRLGVVGLLLLLRWCGAYRAALQHTLVYIRLEASNQQRLLVVYDFTGDVRRTSY